MSEPIRIESNHLRIDMETRFEPQPDGSLLMVSRPHPDRYDWRDTDDGRMLVDCRTGFMYPESVLEQLAANLTGAPMYAPPPGIPDHDTFVRERRAAIEAALSAEAGAVERVDPAGETFAERVGEELAFAVISIDLVDSTRLQASEPDAYARLVPILLREAAEVVAPFGGLVINLTGDGVVIGFPEPGAGARPTWPSTRQLRWRPTSTSS